MARPTLCTPEMIKTLSKAVEKGSTIDLACAMNDICETTYHKWINLAKKGKKPYVDFLNEIRKAHGIREARRVARVESFAEDKFSTDENGNEKLIKGDWQAAAWLLERQHRKEFGRHVSKVKLTAAPEELSEVEKINFLSSEIVKEMSNGKISAEEANLACSVLEQRRKIIETSDLVKRIEKIELGVK